MGKRLESQEIAHLAEKLQPQLVAWRREFHRYPEVGFQEFRTRDEILRLLQSAGVEDVQQIDPTGVMATIRGGSPGPTGFLRFDIDALPIQEETGAPYASTIPGRMHACGHDGHIAIGLGTAYLLHDLRASLKGNVRILFQPAEEGLGGAQVCIASGVLADPEPSFALGMHLWNTHPVGWWGISAGPVMAGSDRIHIRMEGVGGHGAAPHLARDVVLAGAHVLTALQSVISRSLDPLETAVLSMTTFHAGDADNVIPQEAILEGTLRSMDPAIRRIALDRMEEIVQNQAASFGCRVDMTITPLTTPLRNDEEITSRVLAMAKNLFPDAEMDTAERVMASEDMAAYLSIVPGCYTFVGSSNPDRGLCFSHHHPKFDFDETVMHAAVALLTASTMDLLEDGG
ncbi:MAG: amidohydrolase [Anaerolineales bacterium]|nr:amidohydrolase [Anaerolineales bacterium]